MRDHDLAPRQFVQVQSALHSARMSLQKQAGSWLKLVGRNQVLPRGGVQYRLQGGSVLGSMLGCGGGGGGGSQT